MANEMGASEDPKDFDMSWRTYRVLRFIQEHFRIQKVIWICALQRNEGGN
jgi:hypothetical protein